MPESLLKHRLTARETLLVLIAAVSLGLLGYFSYDFVKARLFAARIQVALPGVLNGIRNQRKTLVAAIEAYRAQFGAYPADHVLQRQPMLVVDPVTNALLYELAGVVYTPANHMFHLAGLEEADAVFVTNLLQSPWFRNCGEDENHVKHFLSHDQLPPRQFHDDPDVYVLGVPLEFGEIDPAVVYAIHAGTSSWRYVSSAPTNNPGKFDLWVDIKADGKSIRIGNWKAVE